MPKIYLGVGSNIDPQRNVHQAIVEMQKRFGTLRTSPIYCSPAYGFQGDDFHNLVVETSCTMDVPQLLSQLKAIEHMHRRQRGGKTFASRRLDIDLLLYGELVDPTLDIPRQDIRDYPFVLKPLADLAPNLIHPGLKLSIAALWKAWEGDKTQLQEVQPEMQL